ncbi:MAG: FAD-dependent oxidoreductase, partial [Kiritimatiellia bacterium]
GGGDTACEDALFLARLCKSVLVVHRRDAFRASKVMVDRVLSTKNITVAWNSVITEIADPAKGEVTAVTLRDTQSGAERSVPVNAVFVAIGNTPNTAFLKGVIDLDAAGYIATDGVRTSVAGVFAAGDVQDPKYKQAIIAAGAGAAAALEAERFLLH